MKVHFLEARVPLTKRYTTSAKDPYPNAYEFKSHDHVVASLSHFASLMQQHAALGHCLLKGTLSKPVEWESRAGSTNPHDPTGWLCLDFDGLKSLATIDDALTQLGIIDVSYIVQWSASYLMYGDISIRAHVFIFTKSNVAPAAAKIFLKQKNLEVFQADLALTKTNVALRWPLDITTCQNDKLIYITPPQFDPPSIEKQICAFTGQRISVVQKAHDFFDFAAVPLMTAEQVKTAEEAAINRLRQQANLPERKASQFKMKEFKGESYLASPDQATLTGIKEERGFVYLNLNGGDSWGYFHPTDNPTFINNFKGEPAYRTSEILPDYWASLQTAKRSAVKAQQKGRLFLAFRDLRTAAYFNGWYDQGKDEVVLHTAKSERQVEDFLLNFGQPVPEAVPIWSVTYDPQLPTIDLTAKMVNVFQASYYMKQARQAQAQAKPPVPAPTPNIERLIKHVFGDASYPNFINWLANSFQNCSRPSTAWIAQGVQGTGKGVLVNNVIVPVFGASNVTQKRMEELEDKFNGHLENDLICVVDEAQISDSGRSKMIMANLKNQITEPTITVRNMRQSAYEVPNRVGFIFCSNQPDAVVVEASDRRFNVGEYQNTKIDITQADIDAIQKELMDFAHMLQAHKIDYVMLRTPADNEAKRQMIMVSRSSADAIADAIRDGNLSMLWDALPTVPETSLDVNVAIKLQPYKHLIYELVHSRRDRLTREELLTIFDYNVGNVASSPWKFTVYLKHHGLQLKEIRVGTRTTKGVLVQWAQDDAWFEERLNEIAAESAPKLKALPVKPPVSSNVA